MDSIAWPCARDLIGKLHPIEAAPELKQCRARRLGAYKGSGAIEARCCGFGTAFLASIRCPQSDHFEAQRLEEIYVCLSIANHDASSRGLALCPCAAAAIEAAGNGTKGHGASLDKVGNCGLKDALAL